MKIKICSSSKEVLNSLPFTCLFVHLVICLLAELYKSYCLHLYKNDNMGLDPIKFCY